MAIESSRGCGYRKVGGLYLRGTGLTGERDRLNYDIEPCPVCNNGIKFSRAFAWLKWDSYAEKHKSCKCPVSCPICNPAEAGKIGLMWIGEQNYTPASFIAEARDMKVSKRIGNIPRGLVMDKTWVFLAHRKAGTTKPNPLCKYCLGKGEIEAKAGVLKCVCSEPSPAIFYAFRVERIEKLILKSEVTEETLFALEGRGIVPVIVPDGDLDHRKGTPKSNKPEGVSQKNKKELEILDNFNKEAAPEIESKIPVPEAQEIPKTDMDWDNYYADIISTEEGEPIIEKKPIKRRRRAKELMGEELKNKLEERTIPKEIKPILMEEIPDLTQTAPIDSIEKQLLNQKRHKEELKARFCFGCGSEIKIKGRFCINCGTDIRDIA